jgi:hypothetical protein
MDYKWDTLVALVLLMLEELEEEEWNGINVMIM